MLTLSSQRGLIGPIISRFENRGFKLTAIKLVTPGKEHLEKHYADLAGKPFFPGLISCRTNPAMPRTAAVYVRLNRLGLTIS
jgi:nucleoside diphosphate kinase